VKDVGALLSEVFGPDRVRRDAALAPFTTFKVGGPADWLVETQSSDEIVTALRIAHSARVPVTMLGGGSNVLIADTGVRGLVLRTRGGQVRAIAPHHVRADAAVSMTGLVRWTINHGYAGLERWAGTPGTVGGAIVGNAHFGEKLIGELVSEVQVASPDGALADVPSLAMAFGYDRSRIQRSGEVLLSVVFSLSHGEPAVLRAKARESLLFRKRTQPLDTHNAGCVFQNPDPVVDGVPEGVPPSAGALIDRAGLKGTSVGGARVSLAHGNFIVNEGGATARDIRRLMAHCRAEVRSRFGVDLRAEIVFLGEHDDVTD
jgi:UDP-N-acetylmuramate dehydrogenase